MLAAIVGSRTFNDYDLLCNYMDEVRHFITEIVSGGAPGADSLGEQYARENKIPFKVFPAEWNNLDAPNAKLNRNRWGKLYNVNAGKDRNQLMANYLKQNDGKVVAFWDRKSPGTAHMINCCNELGVQVFIVDIGGKQ